MTPEPEAQMDRLQLPQPCRPGLFGGLSETSSPINQLTLTWNTTDTERVFKQLRPITGLCCLRGAASLCDSGSVDAFVFPFLQRADWWSRCVKDPLQLAPTDLQNKTARRQ